ncbi:MAG: MFS transporter [Propionibacteriaceae bacterium]|nr:MFS transporter [Propionibacteriaceae bacterium]
MVEARRSHTHRPVLAHLGLFRLRTFRYGAIAAFIVHLGEFGLLFTLPLVLQEAMGYGPLGTGGLILALALGTFVASGLVPAFTRRLGQQGVVRLGLALELGTVACLSLSLPGAAWLLAGLLFGYGAGSVWLPRNSPASSSPRCPTSYRGEAPDLQTTVRQLGSALGVALVGGLLISSLAAGTEQRLHDASIPEPARSGIVAAVRGSVGGHRSCLRRTDVGRQAHRGAPPRASSPLAYSRQSRYPLQEEALTKEDENSSKCPSELA